MGSLTGFAPTLLHGAPLRALAACLAVAGLARLALPAQAAAAAAGATALGWATLDGFAALGLPHTPFTALPGLALLAWAAGSAAARAGNWVRVWLLPALAAWWLRGAPLSHLVVQIVPVFLGLAAILALVRRAAPGAAPVWAIPAAATAFALAAQLSGAPPAWVAAAAMPGAAALVWWNRAEAATVLGPALVLAAAALVVAADRGRLNARDAAAAVPVLVLCLAPRLAGRPSARARKPARRRSPARRRPKATPS